MDEKSGVNVDQEMAHLIALQTAYGANARVMSAIKEMLELLMRM
jgi:flagellar hook-associated protein 1 FlgK